MSMPTVLRCKPKKADMLEIGFIELEVGYWMLDDG
jgi:hypothetical protein